MSSLTRRQLAMLCAAGAAAQSLPAFGSVAVPSVDIPPMRSLKWTNLHPGIWRARLGVPEAFTPISSRLVPPALSQLEALPSVPSAPIPDIGGHITTRGCQLHLPLEPNEMLYGFGLQFQSFQQRSKKKMLRVNADPTGDTGDTHAPVPFYVSTNGYGIFVDSFRQTTFYCGDTRSAPSTGHIDREAASATKPASGTDKSGEVIVEVPRSSGVDIYLFAGPNILNAVQRYNSFSGGAFVPPEWGLGFWYRAGVKADQQSALALAQELRDRQIPCDVFGLEPGWQSHSYSCSFTWDSSRFPNPNQFLKDVAKLDYKVNLWEHAFTNPSSPIFEPLSPHAGDYGVWGGLVPDFAGEPARRIFGDYHGKALIDAGVSGFKLDECDNSDYTRGWSFPDMSRFPSGADGEQMHAVFGLRYQHALWKPFLDRHQETYSLVRSSGALATPYPYVLYSDLYDHRQFVRALVNSSFSGLLWCPEVRNAASEEDLIRRLQTVVFSPLAMVNAWNFKMPPWKQVIIDDNKAGKVAEGWQTLEARCREIIGWRMQLVPYLQSAFQRYAANGTPPFRALVLDYPSEKNVMTVDDQFLVGDRMLVAPLFAGETSRQIVLPSGVWHDYWTGKTVQEGSTVTVSSATQNIPVYVKAGSVLPIAEIGPSSGSVQSRNLTVRIYGDGSLPWQMKLRNGANLEFSWDSTSAKGKLQTSGPGSSDYRAVQWQQMG